MSNSRSQGGVWSQFNEDGIITDLVARLPGVPRTFVEIGCGDGSENNTRLLLEQGWLGTWIDASEENIAKAALINPNSLCERITCENMPPANFGFIDLGLFSIDVDGNDYHLWKRSHELGWRPWVVVIEAQIQPNIGDPWTTAFVQPYDPEWVWPDNPATEDYHWGASAFSLVELGKKLGYRYYGKPENPHSPNLFFVREDLALG